MVLICQKHNLPEEIICVGQYCTKRIGCKLCVDKHHHKFYLDNHTKDKLLVDVQQQLNKKIITLKKYTLNNINNLKLNDYKNQLLKSFQKEEIYLKSKITQETLNFNLLIEKCQTTINECIQRRKKQIIKYWEQYYNESLQQIQTTMQFDIIETHFNQGDWTTHQHVQKSISFLYSEELLFRFNRNIDSLKKWIRYHKKQNESILEWLEDKRLQFHKYNLCPHSTFAQFITLYNDEPNISEYRQQKTKQTHDDHKSLLQIISQDMKHMVIYPKITYDPYQQIYKILRYDNHLFATSGSRSINIWSKIALQPQLSYKFDYPSYGMTTFIQKGQQEADRLIFGLSNGSLGVIDMKKEKYQLMNAHTATIRDIIQYDSYHFLTASQDWLIKLWGINKSNEPTFASERLQLKGHSGKVHCLAKFGPNILSGGSDDTVKMWDISRQCYDQQFVQEQQINCILEIRPQLFVVAGQIKQLRGWDYRKPKQPAFKFDLEYFSQTLLKYDNNNIILNDKHMVKIIDIRNIKQPILRMNNNSTYSNTINSMDFLSDIQIGMGGNDNIVTIWKY